MMHLNEGFFRNVIFFAASAATAIGGWFFGGYFDMKRDITVLKTQTQAIEVQTAKDMQRIETGLEKLNDKFDIIFEKLSGPAYRDPPR